MSKRKFDNESDQSKKTRSFLTETEKESIYQSIQEEFNISPHQIDIIRNSYKNQEAYKETIYYGTLTTIIHNKDLESFKKCLILSDLNTNKLEGVIEYISCNQFNSTNSSFQEKRQFIDFTFEIISSKNSSQQMQTPKIEYYIKAAIISEDFDKTCELFGLSSANNIEKNLLFALNKNSAIAVQLLEKYCKPNELGEIKVNPTNLLQSLINTEEVESVKQVIKVGGDINHVNSNGDNLLHQSAYSKITNVTKFLAETHFKDKLNLLNRDGETIFKTAIEKQDYNFAKNLIKLGFNPHTLNKNGENALFSAIEWHADFDLIKHLVENHFANNVNMLNNNNQTIFQKIFADDDNNPDLQIVTLLANHGANVNFIDKDGNNALHLVSNYDDCVENTDVLEYLIKNHLKHFINKKNNFGNPPILNSIRNDEIELVEKFIELGANTNFINNEESIKKMVQSPDCLEYFIKNNIIEITPNLLSHFTQSAYIDLQVILDNIKINAQNIIDQGFLNDCLKSDGYLSGCAILFYNYGANIFQLTGNGQNAALKAINDSQGRNQDKLKQFVEEKICTEILLKDNHPEKSRYLDLLKNFTTNNPEKVAEINQLKIDETFVILNKILTNHTLCLRLAELLKLDNRQNAMVDPKAKIPMVGIERNREIKDEFRDLFQEFKGNEDIKTQVIGRMLKTFKLNYGYEPIAKFSSQQLTIRPFFRDIISSKIASNDDSILQTINEAIENPKLTDNNLRLLIAAANLRPQERKANLTNHGIS